MIRTENDLRNTLHELGRRSVEQNAPSLESILAGVTKERPGRLSRSVAARWRAPVAVAAAVVVAAGVTTMTLRNEHNGSSPQRLPVAAPRIASTAQHPSAQHPSARTTQPSAGTVLNAAAARLDAAPAWTTPSPQNFFYIETTEATTWTSVSGTRAGSGQTADGHTIWVAGCKNGHIVSPAESGTCTLGDVGHYLDDAPMTPSAWGTYLEQLAPGAEAANAQGKIIVEVLHQDLTAPKAAAALLRYTASCPGLHTFAMDPVAGKNLVGVTCTSMTNGSYGLVFDANSQAFLGFVGVTMSGKQSAPAELVRKIAIVTAIGQKP